MKHLTTTDVGGDRLQKLTAQRPAKPALGNRLLAATARLAKVAPVKDSKGETNVVATLIKSIHAGQKPSINTTP